MIQKFSISLSEPDDNETDAADHYATCAANPDNEDADGPCDCEEETQKIRADFALEMRRCY